MDAEEGMPMLLQALVVSTLAVLAMVLLAWLAYGGPRH